MDVDRGWTWICRAATLVAALHHVLFNSALAQQQFFMEAPSNVSVIQRQVAILKCQVGARKGHLQWTKNGFALGFARDIPGFPRYRMDGSEALGENHLIIENAQLEDDAEYQCQVGPAAGEPALLGVAFLSVIIPPRSPTIEGYQNGSLVKVPHTLSTLSLTCTARDGKPAAVFKWLRNGIEIIPGSSEDTKRAAAVEYTTEREATATDGREKLITGKSVLTIIPTDEDNDAYYTCQAMNEAMQRPAGITVQLNVQHPPGPPEISGYAPGLIIKSGDTMRLVCVSRGGNPLAKVYWYRNGEERDFSYVDGNNRAENEHVFTVQPTDNGAIYRCAASNQITKEPLTAEIKLTVQFAPENVSITGNFNAKAGDSVLLKCESAISNPPAVISWFTRGRQVPGGTSFNRASPKGGFVTSSEIRVTLTERENDAIYQCHGTNDALGQTVISTATLKVMYPPERPTISGYTEGRSVQAGNVQSMTCTSVGGNPAATVSWYKGDKELEGTKRITGNIVSNVVKFLLDSDDNGAEYRCTATNAATTTPLAASVKLKVSFPPKSLNISLSPHVVKVGQVVVITCFSSSSNPASKLSWWKNVSESPSNTANVKQAGDEIPGIDGGTVDAEYGGKSTISRLHVNPTVEDHGEIYACRATNMLIEQAVSDGVTLNVLYKPYFPKDIITSVNVIEHESVVMNVSAAANPSNIVYAWYRGTDRLIPSRARRGDISAPRFRQSDGLLNLTRAERADSAVYIVEASNAEGSTRHSISINVQYQAEIASISPQTLVNEHEMATLECTIRASPIDVLSLISWSRADGRQLDTSRVAVIDVGVGASHLVISDTVRGDSGVYSCTANNGIGVSAVGAAELLVRYAPVVDKSPIYGKAAADKGATAVLLCRAEGVPDVTFSWFKGSVELKPRTSADAGDVEINYVIQSTKKTGLVSYETELHVHNTTKADYGEYMCMARNELGEDSIFITVSGTSRPDSPYDLRFLNATHNSVTVSWHPGFDGGMPVRYQVRYNQVGSDKMRYEDVIPTSGNQYTIGGLELGTEYEVTIKAMNKIGDSKFHDQPLIARTSAVLVAGATSDDVPLFIILTVCIIGTVLLALNILLVLFFIRRRRKKMETDDDSSSVSQANTLEMIDAGAGMMSNIGDDYKSYTTGDQRSVDDLDERKAPFDIVDDRYEGAPETFYPYVDNGGMKGDQPYPDQVPYYSYHPFGSSDSREGLYGLDNGYGAQFRRPLTEEDIYTEQLRKMQRNLGGPRSGGSTSQLSSNGGYIHVAPPRSLSRPALDSIPDKMIYNDDLPRHGPSPRVNHRGGPQMTPPELRGHLV